MKKEQFTTRYNEELVFPDKFLETVKCEVRINWEWEETSFTLKTDKKPQSLLYEDDGDDVRFTCMIK